MKKLLVFSVGAVSALFIASGCAGCNDQNVPVEEDMVLVITCPCHKACCKDNEKAPCRKDCEKSSCQKICNEHKAVTATVVKPVPADHSTAKPAATPAAKPEAKPAATEVDLVPVPVPVPVPIPVEAE